MHVQEKTLTLGKHQVSLKIAPIFNSVFSSISDLFFSKCVFADLFGWILRVCLQWKGEKWYSIFLCFPKGCGAHGCESLPTYFNSTICYNGCFCWKNGVCTVWEWLSPPYTIEADKLGASLIRWVLFWEPLVHSPPNLLCKHVLLGEHHLTFTPETLKIDYMSHCPICSQDTEEQNTNSISGLLLVKGFPNLAFSGAFPVSRRVKNAHKQMKGYYVCHGAEELTCILLEQKQEHSWSQDCWTGAPAAFCLRVF